MLYEFRCQECKREDTMLMPVADMEAGIAPECCGGKMRKILSLPRINPDVDYVTSDITGDPVHITSRRQQRQLCEKYGVTPKLAKPWT